MNMDLELPEKPYLELIVPDSPNAACHIKDLGYFCRPVRTSSEWGLGNVEAGDSQVRVLRSSSLYLIVSDFDLLSHLPISDVYVLSHF